MVFLPPLGEDSPLITCQLKEAETEAELIKQAVTTVRGMMERVASSWETYNSCMSSLQTWLAQKTDLHDQVCLNRNWRRILLLQSIVNKKVQRPIWNTMQFTPLISDLLDSTLFFRI